MKRTILMLLLVVLLGVACGGTETEEAAESELSIVATDIVYDAARLEVPAHQPVHLTLVNAGALEHDFSIREIAAEDTHASEGEADDHATTEDVHDLALHVAAPPGGSGVLEFTPTEAGEYEYYCTVPGHKEAGMVGTLVVTP